MTRVYSKVKQSSIVVDRIITQIEGLQKGATIVFFAGVHGNETAGIFALEQVLKTIDSNSIKGTIYGVSGNLKALQKNQRFIDTDLNRLWTKAQIEALQYNTFLNTEQQEQRELFNLIKHIINTNTGPFYFIDFHTTSSKTLPFITINDALINRKFSQLFPVPIVLGIEEYLDGPMLSFINELGYVSLGFESGQHDDKEAIDNCISFIYLAFVFAEIVTKDSVSHFQTMYNQLECNANYLSEVLEIIYVHRIKKDEVFTMKSGFKSFQYIRKGTLLATCNSKDIKSNYNALLFMPLYQSQGEEGFFIIKTIRPFIITLSAKLRHIKFDSLLVLLPGISWQNNNKEVLKVNRKVARFFAKSIFHILGYRNKDISSTYLLLHSRERTSKVETYKNSYWF